MESDRWAAVERIYHDALARKAGERAAYLDEACSGDDALRREVQSLLDYDGAGEAFLERPALEEEAKGLAGETGPLLAERKIAGYEILALVGAGGMGEVYRARDLTLGREVAIKVLAKSGARGSPDLRRFEKEARLASVLNHPNIVTIYSVGENDGVAHIAMELVRGRTLREVLAGGRLSVKEALDLAVQLADALSAAHANGIVHRDLKPENLMVTATGSIKVLDFGIAKAMVPLAGTRDNTGSSEAFPTQPGSVLGTVEYMSPEQALGRPIDFRSDQFSFGTILYEMVTGGRPWKRTSVAETLTAIIREDPEPIATAAPTTPTALRWIVDRCLAKDPEERYASTRDLARDLVTLKNHLGEITGVGLPARGSGRFAATPRARRSFLIGALGVVAVGAGILLAPLLRKPETPNWIQVGFHRGTVWSGRFAPDGLTIVYSAAWNGDPVRLFSTRPASMETRTLDLPPGKLLSISSKGELAFLRDARFLKFFTQPGTLVTAGLEGGGGRDVLENVHSADWSSDGTQLAVAREVDGKARLEYPIGNKLFESERPISNVRISRDGTWIAFCEGGPHMSVEAVRVSDGFRRVLSEGWFSAAVGLAWSVDGREVWFTPQKKVRDSSPALLAVTLSGKLREVVRGPGQLRLFDVAPDGRVLLARWDLQLGVRGRSSSGGPERELSATDDSLLSGLSKDGRAVLFYDRDELFLRATDGSPPLRLGSGVDGATHLSPDGKWVLGISDESSFPVLVPVGAGEVRRIETQACDCVDWFPDGKRILCETRDPAAKFQLIVLDLSSGKGTEVPIAEEVAEEFQTGGLLSPDGAFLAGVGRDGDILVLPLAGGNPRRIAGGPPGFHKGSYPVGWTADNQHLFLHRGGEVPGKVQMLDLATGRVEAWKDLSLEDRAGVARIGPVQVAADGHSWAFSYVRVLSSLYVVEGLR